MIAPQDVSTRFNYANLLRDMGDCALACGEYEKLIGQFPDDGGNQMERCVGVSGGW